MALIKITQYGKSLKSGGWDPDGDTESDAKIGNEDNTIVSGKSCALTKLAVELLQIKELEWLRFRCADGTYQLRQYGDTAPESDARIDLFNYEAFVHGMPDTVDSIHVEVIAAPEL